MVAGHFILRSLIFLLSRMPTQTNATKTAITPRRDEDFPEWYQQVVRASEMAEPSDVFQKFA